MMGKNREEFQKRLQQRLLEREKRKAMGLDSDAESDSGMQNIVTNYTINIQYDEV